MSSLRLRPAARVLRAGLLLCLAIGAPGALAETEQPTLTSRVDAAMAQFADGAGDVGAARARVAQSVALEAYEGVLKGARGTYVTGAGNSADQALLLKALMQTAAPDAVLRFAACDLDDATLEAEWARASALPPTALDQGEAVAQAVADPELQAAVRAVLALRADAKAQQQAASAYLTGGLAVAPYVPVDGARAAAATLRHHSWLQTQRDGAWQDLDTTTADGVAPCTASETYDALPDELFRTLRISLIIERREGGALSEEMLLDTTEKVANIATSRIAFGFGEAMGLVEPVAADARGKVPFTPVLRIDNATVTGTALVLPSVPKSGISGMGEAVGAIGGALDEPAESDAGGDGVTGAWLAFAFGGPGAATSLRSEVLDRLGPAARHDGSAATAALAPLEIVGGDYAATAALWQISVAAGSARGEGAAVDASLDLTTLDGLSGALDGLLRLYPALRRDLGGASPSDATLLLGGLVPVKGEDGSAGFRFVLDALHIPTVSAANAAGAAADAAAIPAAEHMLALLAGETAGGADSAGAVLGATGAAQVPLIALSPGTPIGISNASAEAAARLEARLAEGFAVLAPASAVAIDGRNVLVWWTIDPKTGLVRDEHESGRHSEMVEYEETNKPALTVADRFRRLACSIVRPLALAGSILFAISGGGSGGDVVKAAVKIATAADENRKKGEAAKKIACLGQGGQGGVP